MGWHLISLRLGKGWGIWCKGFIWQVESAAKFLVKEFGSTIFMLTEEKFMKCCICRIDIDENNTIWQ